MAAVGRHTHPNNLSDSSEEIDTSRKPSKFLPYHIKIMKVALALALIRQRPEGMTAGEYTERLALQFSEMQQDWREKAQELERELLRTRQELARFQVQAEGIGHSYITRRGAAGSGGDSDWQSSSSGYCSSAPQTANEELMEQQQRVGSDTGTCKSDIVSAHIKFLSSVSSILRSRECLSVLAESDLRATVRDTVLQATRGLSEVLSVASLPVLPPSLGSLQTAIETIVEAVKAPRMHLFQAEMVEACNHLLKSITTRISSHQDPKPHSEALCGLVCTLSSVPALYWQAVQQLTAAILECAHMLSSSTQDVSLLDIGTVEATANVFKTLETLFTKYDTSALPQQLCVRLCGDLEGSILKISATYPLFVFSVWRVLAHLATAHM